MKPSPIARGIVEIQDAKPLESHTVPVIEGEEDKVLVEIRIKRFFVYEGEEGARFETVTRQRRLQWRHGLPRASRHYEHEKQIVERVFTGLDDAEKHAFVQRSNGMLTPFGAMEMRGWLHELGWSNRDLAERSGVNVGAVRDALLMTSSATNTYPLMLAAVRIGLDAKARLDAVKAKAAA